MKWARKHRGFTIVELLIVIVMVAILATITIVAYNGIRERAEQSAQESSLSQAARKLLAYAVENTETYPASLAVIGISDSDDTSYTYQADNTVSPAYYCVSVTVGGQSTRFLSSKNAAPAAGSCVDLVGWWPFNGDYSDYAKDAHAVTALGPVTSTTGQNSASGAYQFGAGDGLAVDNFDYGVMRQPNPGSSWSMSAWVQTTNVGAVVSESIVVGRYGCHGGLYTYDSSSLPAVSYYFAIKSSSNTSNCWSGASSAAGVVIDNSWHFLVATYEAGAMRMYVDGVLTGTGSVSALYGYSTSLRIGGSGAGRPLPAKLDDVRVYTRVLSQAEVAGMYAAGAF